MKEQMSIDNRNPRQVRFELKCNEIKNYEKFGLFAICLSAYFRIKKLSFELEQQYLFGLISLYLFSGFLMTYMLKAKIHTEKELNIRVFFYDKFYLIFTCVLTYFQLQVSNGQHQYDYLYITIAFHSMLHSCYIIPIRIQLLNILLTWTIYICLLLKFSSSPEKTNSIVFIIVFVFYMVKKHTFSSNQELCMDNLYKELKQNQQLLTQILSYLPEGVLIFKTQEYTSYVSFWNSSAKDIILQDCNGKQEQDVYFEDVQKIQVKQKSQDNPNDNIEENLFQNSSLQIENIQAQNSLWNIIREMDHLEVKQLKLLKSKRRIEAFKISMQSNDGIMIFLRDITAIRDKQRSEISQQMQSIFLSSISHDLKTPINQVLSTNSYLQNRFPDKKERKILKMQETSCIFMLSLIDDIIDLSKFELKKFELSYSTFSLPVLLKEVCDLVGMKAEEKKINIDQQVNQNVPELINQDRKRLKQILMNLLSNAVKFTFKGKITIKVEIQSNQINFASFEIFGQQVYEEEKKEGDFGVPSSRILQISVTDSGIGISEQNQSKLFKLFGMVGKTRNINPNGTGLGLVICKRLSEAMGGSISVKSEEGEGSTFTIYLRLRDLEQQPSQSNFFIDSQRSYQLSSLECIDQICSIPDINSINLIPANYIQESQQLCDQCSKFLVIDDDSFNIFAFQLLLESCTDEKMDSSLSGSSGIQKMKEKLQTCCQIPYKVVIIDLNMPQMNGDEMMSKVQEMIRNDEEQMSKYSNTKFVLCTAQSPENVEYFQRMGFCHFLEKPVSMKQLSQILHLD